MQKVLKLTHKKAHQFKQILTQGPNMYTQKITQVHINTIIHTLIYTNMKTQWQMHIHKGMQKERYT